MSIYINRPVKININCNSNIAINYEYKEPPLILELSSPPSNDVNYWNSFFNLPPYNTYGNPFTSAEVDGNTVKLYGGSNITIPSDTQFRSNYDVVSIIDNASCITTLQLNAIVDCGNLTTANLPGVTSAGEYALASNTLLTSIYLQNLTTIPYNNYIFSGNFILTTVSLPSLTSIPDNSIFSFAGFTSNTFSYLDISSCTDLGGTQYDDNVFNAVTGIAPTFTLIANDYLRTNNPLNGVSPNWPDADGDIAYLDANYTLNVTWV